MKRKLSLLAVAMAAAVFSLWWALSAVSNQTLVAQPLQPFGPDAQGEATTAQLSEPTVDGVVDATGGCSGDAPGMANPAAVYCYELGYEYKLVDTAEGQYGICVFPDGSRCDEWRFLEGKCGQSYSYCARQGYDLITKSDGKNPFSIEYGVCVEDGREIGSVTELMGLGEKAARGSRPVEQGPSPPEEAVPAYGQPSSFDWRTHDGQDWMTSVKNQASCGGCWAFSAVGTTEAVHNIDENDPSLDLDLSEEYLVSDCYTDWSQGCCGGWPEDALRFIASQGIPDEGCLPWVSGTCGCDPAGAGCDLSCTYHSGDSCSNATCSDRCADWQSRLQTPIYDVGPVSAAEMKQYVVDRGPLAVALGYGEPGSGFDAYGIYRCEDYSTLNHAVVIAGYVDGSPPSGGYWIVKNSWGSSWNGDGYFKVGYGECGIETDVYYAADFDHEGCVSYTSTDVPKTIPDPGTVTSNLNVGDSFTLVDVNVGPLNITHTWDSDLDVFLISPAGTRVELFTDVGVGYSNFINTTLDDECGAAINAGWPPFRACYRPEGSLSDLDDEDSSGQWQLEITDDWGTDQGTLNSWQLELCDGPTLQPDLVVTSVSDPPSEADPGDSFSVTDTTHNQGASSADPSTTHYYLSTDQNKGGDIGPTGSRSVPGLAPGASDSGTVTVSVPPTTPYDTYYLLACADDSAAVPESNEDNNCLPSTTTVDIIPPTQPDVVVTKTDDPDPVCSEGDLTYHLEVCNIGGATATGVTVDDELPPEVTFVSASPGCTYITGVHCDLPDLAPSQCHTVDIQVTAPSVASTTVITNDAVADAANEPVENSGNNDDDESTTVNLCDGVATVRIGTGAAPFCTEATVALEVLGVPEPGVMAVKVDILYDPNIIDPVSYTKNADWDLAECNLEYEKDGINPDVVRCGTLEAAGMVGDAPVAEISFHCIGETGECSPLDVDIVKFTDPDGNPMSVTAEDGEFCCGLCGDVNCDGEVDIVDAGFVLQYDLGLRECSDQCPPLAGTLYCPAGDVNCDEEVDIVDAGFILQYDLGLRDELCVCP